MKKLILAGLFSIFTFHTAVNAKTEEPIQLAQLTPAKPAPEKQKATNMRENKKIMLNQEEVEKNAKQKQQSSNAPGADRLHSNRGYNDPSQTDNPGLGHDRGFNKGKSEKDNNRFNNANPPNKIHRSNDIHMGVPTY